MRSPGERTSRTEDEKEDRVLDALRGYEPPEETAPSAECPKLGEERPDEGNGVGLSGWGERVPGTLTGRVAEAT